MIRKFEFVAKAQFIYFGVYLKRKFSLLNNMNITTNMNFLILVDHQTSIKNS